MCNHFRKLGTAQRQEPGEEEALGRKIFQTLKKGQGKGGVFFKKPSHGNSLIQINDDVALQKIIRDLKRRMESSDKWLMSGTEEPPSTEKKPRLPPTRKTLQSHQQQMKKPTAEKIPTSQPPSLPNSSKPRLCSTRKTQYFRQQNPSKAAPGAKPQLPQSRHVRASSPQRPLAPIFLKSYRKKKKKLSAPGRSGSANGRKNEKAPRRYPERKRKQITDDCHVVSDDATLSAVLESRKKMARIK